MLFDLVAAEAAAVPLPAGVEDSPKERLRRFAAAPGSWPMDKLYACVEKILATAARRDFFTDMILPLCESTPAALVMLTSFVGDYYEPVLRSQADAYVAHMRREVAAQPDAAHPKSFAVFVTVEIHEDRLEDFLNVMKEDQIESPKEEKCLHFDVLRSGDAATPNVIMMR